MVGNPSECMSAYAWFLLMLKISHRSFCVKSRWIWTGSVCSLVVSLGIRSLPCMAETAGTTFRIGQLIRLTERDIQIRRNDHLGNAVPVVNFLDMGRIVVQSNHDFSTVVTINNTDAVRRAQSVLYSKSASGIDKPCIPIWQLHSKPSSNHHCFSGCNDGRIKNLLETCVEVVAGSTGRTGRRGGCTVIQFFIFNVQHSFFSFSVSGNFSCFTRISTSCCFPSLNAS
nr:MAG TPA: hypothetical protein [Caudoviricetes sp.]